MKDGQYITIKVNTEEVEKALDLIKNLKSLGLRKKTLNLLIKDICKDKEK